MPAMRKPITFYNPAVAPSGASFYRGQRFPQFANNLFVGTLRGTHLLRLRLDPAVSRRIVAQERLLEGQFGRIRDVVVGPRRPFCTSAPTTGIDGHRVGMGRTIESRVWYRRPEVAQLRFLTIDGRPS